MPFTLQYLFDENTGTHVASFKCDLCAKRFFNHDYLEIHRSACVLGQGHHPTCDICGKQFPYRDRLRKHRAMCDAQRLHPKCFMCNTHLASPDKVAMHMRSHIPSDPFSCHLCFYSTNTTEGVRKHIADRHPTRAAAHPHTDAPCGVGTHHRPFLHTEAPHPEDPFTCNLCAQRFSGEHALQSHAIRNHSTTWTLKCPRCTWNCTTEADLLQHMLSHTTQHTPTTPHAAATPDPRTWCSHCDKALPPNTSLQQHLVGTHRYTTL